MADSFSGSEVAIIGLAGRFPGARDLDEFWRNICDGVESIRTYSEEEALASGADPELVRHPRFIRAASRLEDVTGFDAAFFGYTPREAELMDPQHRLFLECAWEALESSGHCVPDRDQLVGVFGGQALSTYLLMNLLANSTVRRTVDPLQLNLGSAGSFLTTRVSYKLDLKGPSYNVESACSTSLVAVHVATQSLLNGECDVALAGGVSINLTQQHGYLHVDGGILSPEGSCRPFDASAKGIVFGSGVGVVALRRLEDAIADGDPIYAVIRGSAVNNDGALKGGYTAPSVEGQAEVIAEAMANAGVDPESIAYVETHGTGTALGDPIEVQALNKAFGGKALPKGSCTLGALKANIGHLDAAAGVAGLIKASLALHHRQLPPHPLFDKANPHVPWAEGPFDVNTDLREWKTGAEPRRAGVSSFGMGGTNAHVILEESPERERSAPSRALQLLPLSAKTPTALDAMTARLAGFLRKNPTLPLADVAYTLQVGRRGFPHRRLLVCSSLEDALDGLAGPSSVQRLLTASTESATTPVVFLFPGQGAQYARMGAGLYESEPTFREHVDACASALRPHLGLDLRELLFPPAGAPSTDALLEQTRLAQAALFTVEYALARLWMSWGVVPEAMMGHSIGEYVAACLSGVLELEDALALVAARGALMQELPSGSMLSVTLPEAELRPLLGARLSIAAVNASAFCVASGPTEDVLALQQQLTARGTACRLLHTSHAFHSAMVEPILERFTARVRQVKLGTPRIPYVSNLTGKWITPEQAKDPRYWADHLRQAVRFADGLETLAQQPGRVLLEVGPGRTLSTFAARMQGVGAGWTRITSMRHPEDQSPDARVLHEALGHLWLAGVPVEWKGYHGGARRHRVALPTYPFERQRYWISPDTELRPLAGAQAPSALAGDASNDSAPAASSERPTRPALRNAFVAPRDDHERNVARVWEEVLGVHPVGIHDNFFELGGHSLLATAVVGRLRDSSGLSVPLQLLFEGPTVAQMAERLGGLAWKPPNDDPERDALLRMLAELVGAEELAVPPPTENAKPAAR